MSFEFFFCLLLFIFNFPKNSYLSSVTVMTSKGPVNGFLHNGAAVFLGIPFANPPIGSLRFMPPELKTTWTNTLETQELAAACYQEAAQKTRQPRINFGTASQTDYSEDCLYLNILSPNVSLAAKKPVMVYIHGGAFQHGSSAEAAINGTIKNLVNRGVVVVSINYRLNVFGFFTTHTAKIPGNYGLMDQIMALRWVQAEISRFGGDPKRVTIFGESAGSASVSILTLSPMARGLFQNAIMQSGSAFNWWAVSGNNNIVYPSSQETAAKVNCSWNRQLLSCMQKVPMKVLFEAGSAAAGSNLVWIPTKDGQGGVIPDSLENLARTRPSNVSLIFGTNHDEWADYFLVTPYKFNVSQFNQSFVERFMSSDPVLKGNFGRDFPTVSSLIKFSYMNSVTPPVPSVLHTHWLNVAIQIYSGYFFFSGVVKDYQLALLTGNRNVYVYSFDYKSDSFPYVEGFKSTSHAFDLIFLFQLDHYASCSMCELQQLNLSASDLKVSDQFGSFWTSFAIERKPSLANSNIYWKPIDVTNPDQFLAINNQSELKQYYHRKSSSFWNTLIPAILGTDKCSEKTSTAFTSPVTFPSAAPALFTLPTTCLLLEVCIVLFS